MMKIFFVAMRSLNSWLAATRSHTDWSFCSGFFASGMSTPVRIGDVVLSSSVERLWTEWCASYNDCGGIVYHLGTLHGVGGSLGAHPQVSLWMEFELQESC